jgi:hypothetical protein
MIIKGKKHKKNITHFLRKLFNKKIIIISAITFLILLFILGTVFGLTISKFFGSFDNPSKNAVTIVDAIGLKTIAKPLIPTIQNTIHVIRGIKEENIMIPINIIKGFLSNPDKLYIDIEFENYQKIAYKREKSIAVGILITEDDDYVPAEIRYNDQTYRIDMRLKGDRLDHLMTDQWSFRIKLKDSKTLFDMRKFSIQRPEARNWLNEMVYQHAMKKENIITPRTKFVEIIINGKNKGIYEIEEHFDKIMVEDNQFREGPILKFNENLRYLNKIYSPSIGYDNNAGVYMFTDIDTVQTNKILNDPIALEQYNTARNLLEAFRQGKLSTSQVFDVEKMAKYFAISELTGGQHGLFFHNHRFYYNPVTSKLEPMGFDGNAGQPLVDLVFLNEHIWMKEMFKDIKFFELYIKELEKISNTEYLDNIFTEMQKNNSKNINILHKESPLYYFSKDVYYSNAKVIEKYLNPIKGIQAYFSGISKNEIGENIIVLKIGNVQSMPITIESIKLEDNNEKKEIILHPERSYLLQPYYPENIPNYQKISFKLPQGITWKDEYAKQMTINFKILGTSKLMNGSVFQWDVFDENFVENDFMRQESNINEFEFIEIIKTDIEDKNTKNIIKIKRGQWNIDKDIIIPKGFVVYCEEGTVLNLLKGSTILSYSPVIFIGNKDEEIKIISTDTTGEGFILINAKSKSEFKNVVFDNQNAPSKQGWEITGGVTFYQSDVDFENVRVSDARSEDGLNIIRSNLNMKNIIIENTYSDAFDIDFGTGKIDGLFFSNCGNDCLDISGTQITVNNIKTIDVGDKGISIGENSNAIINNVKIENAFIGVASKDKSILTINNLDVINSKYAFGVYQKKPEYGPATIKAKNVWLESNEFTHIIEEESSVNLDNKEILGIEKEVYIQLYGGEE